MAKLKKLADRAKKARGRADQSEARGTATVADKAKVAKDVAREKPPSRPA